MARPTSTKSKSSSSNKAAGSVAQKAGKPTRVKPTQTNTESFMENRVKRDIGAISFIILGIVLLVCVLVPTTAVITSFVSRFMGLSLGIGSYLIPLLFVAIGACILFPFEKERVPLRVAFGTIIIIVALLGMLSLFTPGAAPETTGVLFTSHELVVRGGYLGAALAWAGLRLFGQVISAIIFVGLMIVGLVVIGFSLSRFIEKIRDARRAAAELPDEDGVFPAPPFARVRQLSASLRGHGETQNGSGDARSSQKTAVLSPSSTSEESLEDQKTTRLMKPRFVEVQPTVAFGKNRTTPNEAQGMTRKLGSRASDEKKTDKAHGDTKPIDEITPVAREDGFMLPLPSMLKVSRPSKQDKASEEELRDTAGCLQDALASFQIYAEVVGWVAGPTVTLFKVNLPSGVRVSRITQLEDDIALALAAPGVRIFAPIPGTNYVGIEVPNRTRQTVLLGDVIKDAGKGPLEIVIGKDVEGRSIISDLAKMPHLLIGGTTGSGKSVSINAMIMSILMRSTPSEVRFIMIDPKRVEFTPYNGIPHLYVPVVTEPREAASALSWGVAEMERRLKVFSKAGARNIGQYNAKVVDGTLEDEEATKMPYIVIIIDELADLMMNVGKEVEFSISRIAQLARAAGIHLIVATQRPSTNVVTGLIKANITNRIAFNVASGIDSRVILDTPGAENLIGLGDLLLSKPELAKPQRIQGCYVSEDEINQVVEFLKEQGEPEYHSEILKTNLITLGASQPDGSGGTASDDDPLIWEAAEIVVNSGLGSTSNIQRRLKVGYSRAGRIMDMLEEKGVVGPPNGSKPREVLVDVMELETLKAFEANDSSDSEG